MRSAPLVFAFLLAVASANAQDFLSCGLAQGWQPTGPERHYTPDNLYDYKDGGAESYLLFGFASMQSIECKSGPDTLSIDISEMNDPDSAYGIFTANRDAGLPVLKLGMGGQVQAQSALFAKGKYFVEIAQVTANTAADNRSMLQALATAIADRLEGQTSTPAILDWFPKDDLVTAGLVPESVLGMRILTRGYVAKYKTGQAFIVPQTSPQAAAEVIEKLRARFDGASPATLADQAFQAKAQYLGGICFFRKGRYIGGYANQPDPQSAVRLAAQLATRIP